MPRPAGAQAASSSSAPEEGRFPPGTVLAQRYRILIRLGQGGMGEVYKATDLLLGQVVALKFLPEKLAGDPVAIERFRSEVRLARQVSHPNVCRVYDMGEAEGQLFLSMEYVDGEDLESLLRRIGRLPPDKAAEIARQLSAGLGAAHEQGVLHRDLKPGNIMIDGRGQARITDFGLAGIAGMVHPAEIRSGTPAYMAPEQLEGQEVTARSDIYALGLVLFEVFSGKRPFEAPGVAETLRKQKEAPPSLTRLARDVDPAVERAIARCLDPDPRKRPSSALSVAAALPGGDPLAAALAAGETPSPGMLAAAGPAQGMSIAWAVVCVGMLVVGLAEMFYWHSKVSVPEKIPTIEAPDELAGRAREYIRAFGYFGPAKDRAMGWTYNRQLLNRLWREPGAGDWASALRTLRPPAVAFWYRQSPWGLHPLAGPQVTRADPWFSPSSIEVVLDPQGRLVEFHAAAPEVTAYEPAAPPDWSQAFAAAGLDAAKLTPAEPRFTPRSACDLRQAWTGVYPMPPATPVRVEAAAYEGRVSSFRVVAPHYGSGELDAGDTGLSLAYGSAEAVLAYAVVMPLWAAVMAWRNTSRGKADWRGALRLGLFSFTVEVARGLLVTHHVAAIEGLVLWKVLEQGIGVFLILALLYLGFEPYVRRRMPHSLVSWSRILEGRWRDARAGADVLIGLAAFAPIAAVSLAIAVAGGQLRPVEAPLAASGPMWSAMALLGLLVAVWGGLSFLLLFAVLRFALRRTWLAAAALTILLSLAYGGTPLALSFWFSAAFFGVFTLLLARFGLVAAMSLILVYELARAAPFTADLSRWYAWQGISVVAILLILAAHAFRTNLGGRPLWRDEEDAAPAPGH